VHIFSYSCVNYRDVVNSEMKSLKFGPVAKGSNSQKFASITPTVFVMNLQLFEH